MDIFKVYWFWDGDDQIRASYDTYQQKWVFVVDNSGRTV